MVEVEYATDAEFQQLVDASGLPVDEGGIAEWSFDDRCGFINYALANGVELPFVEQKNSASESGNNSENNSQKELLVTAQPASEV